MMCGVGALLISLSCLLHQVSFIHTQVVPNSYFSNKRSVSLNGSHVGGGCSTTIYRNGEFCMAPASSVLFDGVVPTINNCITSAGQLLTFSTHSGSTLSITFTFMSPTSVNGTIIPFTGVSSIDVVLFTCPSRYHARTIGIVVKDNIQGLLENISFTGYTSCDHVIRICTSDNFYTSSNEITLVFIGEQGPSVYLIYLAEVTFYSIHDNHCTVDPITSSTTPRRNYSATTTTKSTTLKTTEGVIPSMTEISTTKADASVATSSCSTLFIAVAVLSCIIILLIVAIIILSVIAIYLFNKKSSAMDTHNAIYESPDDMKEESFHMTTSSVYGIHKAI